MRVVAYCRVSTDQEDQKTSFAAQQEYYLKMFKEQNLDVAKCGMLYKKDKTKQYLTNGIYADEGLSGAKNYNIREAFKQMLKDAKLGKFNRIYVKNCTRFGRYASDAQKLLKELKLYNVEVLFEDGHLSSLNPTHELVINMLLNVAQEESRLKSSAVQFGIRRKQEKGKYHGVITPFGYNRDSESNLIVNDKEADTVKRIFNMYINEGFGSQKIARYLNDNSIPTKLGKMWSNRQICSILQNEIYIGKLVLHKTNVIDVNEYSKILVDEENRIVHNFENLRIIDQNTFQNTQIEWEKRSKDWQYNNKHRRPSNKHIFSNLLVCGNCGSGLRRKKRKAYKRKDGTSKELGYEWACTMNDRYGASRCKYRNSISEENAIVKIKNYINNIDIDKYYQMYFQTYYDKDSLDNEREELNVEIKKIKHRIEVNEDLFSDGTIGKEQFKTRNDKLQNELKEKNTRSIELKNIDNEIEKVKIKFNQLKTTLKEVDLELLDNTILKKIVSKIVFTTLTEEVLDGENFNEAYLKLPIDRESHIISYKEQKGRKTGEKFINNKIYIDYVPAYQFDIIEEKANYIQVKFIPLVPELENIYFNFIDKTINELEFDHKVVNKFRKENINSFRNWMVAP